MAGAGVPGLVSPRFPGAGSPRSLRGVMMGGEAAPGRASPRRPPRLLRATCQDARGVWALGTSWATAGWEGAGRGGGGDWVRVGGERGLGLARRVRRPRGETWGPGQVSQVNGGHVLLCLTVADPQGFLVGDDFSEGWFH